MVDKVEDLRTYLAILDSGGVNAAAAELGIAKSAVSRRLSDLERRLGISLVDRTSRRLELTSIGAEYARRARAILSSLDELDDSVAPRGQSAAITISASSDIVAHLLIPAMAKLAPRFLQAAVDFTPDAVDGSADIEIRIGDAGDKEDARIICTTGLHMCASATYLDRHASPKSAADLDAHRAIVVGNRDRDAWRLAKSDRPVVGPVLRVGDEGAAAAAAIAGLGIAQLSEHVVADELADGRLVRLLEDSEPVPLPVIAKFRTGAGLDARAFVDALAAQLA